MFVATFKEPTYAMHQLGIKAKMKIPKKKSTVTC